MPYELLLLTDIAPTDTYLREAVATREGWEISGSFAAGDCRLVAAARPDDFATITRPEAAGTTVDELPRGPIARELRGHDPLNWQTSMTPASADDELLATVQSIALDVAGQFGGVVVNFEENSVTVPSTEASWRDRADVDEIANWEHMRPRTDPYLAQSVLEGNEIAEELERANAAGDADGDRARQFSGRSVADARWSRTKATWRAHLLPFLLAATPSTVALIVLPHALEGLPILVPDLVTVGEMVSDFVFVLTAFATAAWYAIAVRAHHEHDGRVVWSTVNRSFGRRAVQVTLVGSLAAVAVMLGNLLVVPGIVLTVVWIFAPALLVSGMSGTRSLWASRELVRGHGWSIFATLFAYTLILGVATIPVLLVSTRLFDIHFLSLQAVAPATPIYAVGFSLLCVWLTEAFRDLHHDDAAEAVPT